jgi:hypothetical protein
MYRCLVHLVRVERKREHEDAHAQVLGHRLGWARLRALRRVGARLLDGVRQPAKLGERQHEHRAEGTEHQHRLPPICRIPRLASVRQRKD